MSLTKQIFACILLAGAAGGAFVAYQYFFDGSNAAVIEDGRGSPGGRSVPVELAKAELRSLERTVEAVGTTRARQAVEIVPLTSGRVVQIAFEPSQKVEAGDVLVKLDDDIQQADLVQAEAKLKEAASTVARAQILRGNNTVSEATLSQAVAAEAAAQADVDRARRWLADRTVRAPFSGIVGLNHVDLGARVDDTTVLTTLDDRSEVEVEFALPETLYGQTAPGQTVVANAVAFPGRIFNGRVLRIDSRVDATSRAFKVRATIPNPDLSLPAGMFMHLAVILERREAVMIPEEAIVVEGSGTFVFLAVDGKAVRRDVAIGQREVGTVEILTGVGVDEEVVVRGVQSLRDGMQIRRPGKAGSGRARRGEPQ
ncbi:MAG: efflux RND transporter periplasmic adaptor subunit [Hyphomicrobiales bacterium]|nr:efflux RND transporter periplasmic adaptor subunit [Hyphomicrobiales bacterium]